ncbi:MAG: hydrolase, partial [Gammaproteobacteria bacterium]
KQFLKDITTPTLILHSKDDPFMSEQAIPREEELSESITLELTERGGHVGFVYGGIFKPRYWIEKSFEAFLTGHY